MSNSTSDRPSTPRQLADRFVHDLAAIDPSVATGLGLNPGDDRLPDLSPEGYQAKVDLASSVLAELDALEQSAGPDGWDDLERRCATLLRDRLGIHLEAHAAGEHLREIRNIFGPPQAVRQIFSMMPSTTAEDWSVIARRMARVPAAYRSWTQTLEEGTSRGLLAAPLQVRTVIDQLTEWADTQWWHGFVSAGPAEVQGELVAAADTASAGTVELRDYL